MSGSSPDFFVAGLKPGTGITITGPISGDVTIATTISQVSLSNATGSIGTPLLTGSSPSYQISGLLSGSGISITTPSTGDVTITNTGKGSSVSLTDASSWNVG